MEIKLLDKHKYQGHKLDFSYVSEFYYDLKVDSVIGEYKAYLQKKKFDIPLYKLVNMSIRNAIIELENKGK